MSLLEKEVRNFSSEIEMVWKEKLGVTGLLSKNKLECNKKKKCPLACT